MRTLLAMSGSALALRVEASRSRYLAAARHRLRDQRANVKRVDRHEFANWR